MFGQSRPSFNGLVAGSTNLQISDGYLNVSVQNGSLQSFGFVSTWAPDLVVQNFLFVLKFTPLKQMNGLALTVYKLRVSNVQIHSSARYEQQAFGMSQLVKGSFYVENSKVEANFTSAEQNATAALAFGTANVNESSTLNVTFFKGNIEADAKLGCLIG